MEGKCPACGQQTFFVKEARYDGFTRVGEVLKCTRCGHVLEADADVEKTVFRKPDLFTADDRSPEIHIEGKGETPPFCRHCRHFMVNPFTQRCGRHMKEVAATDTCDNWELKQEKEDGDFPF